MMTPLPGYKLVENFGPDDDYETTLNGAGVEEVVSYVTLDISGVDPALLASCSSYCLIGIDSPTPFLQLSGTTLKGQHQQLLGTELLFVDGKDEVDLTKKSLSLVATTEQRIKFNPVDVVPKDQEQNDASATKLKKKKELPVGTWVGSTVTTNQPTRSRSRRNGSKQKGKGKGKAVEEPGVADNHQPMDVTEG